VIARRASVAIVILLTACGGDEPPGLRAGAAFPPLAFERLGAPGQVAIAAGKATIVNVWATWCEPCRREMQSLERLHRALGPRGLRVVGISVDRDRNLAAEFVLRERLTFATAVDSGGVLAIAPLTVTKFPTTLVIDAAGIVRWREEAARDWSDPGTVERLVALVGLAP
jgi:cytochrome c biogenesis protein CcmG, thiol:disulfide interchange protein DsbE